MRWIANGWPVHIDSASPVRRIWPPPSPVEPSSSISSILLSFILLNRLVQEGVQHRGVRSRRIHDQLRASGRVTRGRIGVQIDQVTKEVAESLGLGKPLGALVRGVESGSPAEKAGVEAGDIITRFDGKTIEKASDLPRFVGSIKPGTRTTFTVFRRGANKELSVVIGEPEPEKAVARKPADREDKAKPSASVQLLGLSVGELAEAQKKELKIRGGVKVDAATEGAARAGLREGDIILALANSEVLSVKDFEAVLGKVDKSKTLSVLFRRGEWAQYALIRPAR